MSFDSRDEPPPDTPPAELPPPDASVEPPASVSWAGRAVALLEVLLCSDFPTQLALGSTLAVLGYRPLDLNGELSVGFVAVFSLLDTALLIALMLFFLRAHGERPADVFLGRQPVLPEASVGVPLIFVALGLGVALLLTLRWLAPSLHTVEHNPLEDLIHRPRDAWLFALVVVVAGGVREELQRAFLLRRFEQWLGGARVGVVVASLAFGAGYLLQGADAAVATGVLGAFWGVVYLRRRSVVAPMISHSGFNLAQIAQILLVPK